MGLGSTARKIQALTETAEELYRKIGEVLERVRAIETSIEDSSARLTSMEERLDRQEALLEAIARVHDIDVDGLAATELDEEPEE